MNVISILGITGDITTCECCGKSNLKKTVVLDIDGNVLHYGVSCAAKAVGLTHRTYTASDAGRLASDLKVKNERAARFEAAKQTAQRLANERGEEFLVCRNRDTLCTPSARAFNFALHGAWVASFQPQAVGA